MSDRSSQKRNRVPDVPHVSQPKGIPDARFIRERIPIADLARELDLEVSGHGMIRCWHPERHEHGDRTPSVGVWKKFNRVKCFGNGCGIGPLGPIDLVIDVLELSCAQAILWIAERFEVPTIATGKHLKDESRSVARYGFEDPLELLVHSGLWAELSPPAQRVAVVMINLADKQQGREVWRLPISYRALRRYSRIGSDQSISRAVQELQVIGWLYVENRNVRASAGPWRETNCYVLTPFSDSVRELANAIARD